MASIRNWEKWQSYRKGRGQPPWIKVHRELLRKEEWAALTDAERGQLVSMWMLAADNHGSIPDDPEVIKRFCLMDSLPNLNKFADLGFIDAKTLPRLRQDCDKTAAQNRIEKKQNRRETEEKQNIGTNVPHSFSEQTSIEIFTHWRELMNHPRSKLDGKRKAKISAALKLGYTVDELKQAIDGCAKSPHHMGQNDQGAVYDSLELILRDAEHIDRFLKMNDMPPMQTSKAERLQASNEASALAALELMQ